MAIVSDFTAILNGFTPYYQNEHGLPIILSYSIPKSFPAYSEQVANVDPGSFVPLSNTAADVVRSAFQQWGAASGIVFIETTLSGDIQVGSYDLSGRPNSAGVPANGWSEGTSNGFSLSNGTLFANAITTKGILFSYASTSASSLLENALHEIGHSIGLKHTFETSSLNSATLAGNLDTTSSSVMSYTATTLVTTLGPLDIQAAQYLYGPNSGDGSKFSSWSFDQGTQTFRANGTSGSDFMRGLNTRNVLNSGDGDDAISTGDYDDVIVAGNGNNKIASGAGNDRITVGNGNSSVNSGAGNDVVILGGGSSSVRGGDGLDTVILSVASAALRPLSDNSGVFYRVGTVTDIFQEIERVQFSNSITALDVNGNAGQAYRMYQAAFARTPDKDGVSFWVSQVDKGTSLHDMAAAFIGSAEFKGIYGANPSVTSLVTGFYTNVLSRAPDSSGLGFWVGQIQSGLSTADMLVGFSESTENKAHVAPAIQNGIELSLSFFG